MRQFRSAAIWRRSQCGFRGAITFADRRRASFVKGGMVPAKRRSGRERPVFIDGCADLLISARARSSRTRLADAHLPGISPSTYRLTANVHPPPPVCNAPARFLSAEPFRRPRVARLEVGFSRVRVLISARDASRKHKWVGLRSFLDFGRRSILGRRRASGICARVRRCRRTIRRHQIR